MAIAMEEPAEEKEVELKSAKKKEKTRSEVKEEIGEGRVNR